MATKISFLNLKGGVGKTSLLVNVGACLAYMGKRVLVVDLDAQSNSSIWLMRLDRWNALNRDPRKFLLHLLRDKDSKIENCIQKNPIKDAKNTVALEGLDLIPASFNLLDLEHEVPNVWEKPFYQRFYDELSRIESEYDYILFDCPPNFFYAPQCAIFSSDWIIVPSNPDALSIIGFHLLTEKLHRFKTDTHLERELASAPKADVLGIVLNAVKPGANIDVPVERFNSQISRFAEQGKLYRDARIFPQSIRHSVTIGRAVLRGLPAVLLPKSQASPSAGEDYIKVAQHLVALTTGEMPENNEGISSPSAETTSHAENPTTEIARQANTTSIDSD